MQKLLPMLKWFTAASLVILALLLCWHCVDIYTTGTAPSAESTQSVYTRSDTAARLETLRIPAAVCTLLCAITGLLTAGERHKSPGLTAENRLRLIRSRREKGAIVSVRETRCRIIIRTVYGAVLLLCLAMSLVYLLDRSNFTSWELEMVVGRMLLHVGPWVLLALAAGYAAMRLCDASMEREITELRALPAEPLRKNEAGHMPVQPVRMVLFLLAALFILLGVMNGGLRDVLVKAINICTECIGLG